MKTVKIMKTKAFMAMAALALVATACSNDEESDNWAGEIRLSSGLTVQQTGTRAATDIQSNQFASEEKIDVFISEATTETPTTTYAQPLVYTAGESGTMNPPTDNQPYFPTSGNKVNIYAYYPSGTVTNRSSESVTFTVKEDQSGETGDANYKKSDLMYGEPAENPVARTSSDIALTFKHLLSKVTIKLQQGAGLPTLTDAVVKLKNVQPSTTLNANTGAISEASGTTTDITVKAKTTIGSDNSAVIVPQTLETSFIEVTLADGGVLTSKGLKDGDSNPINSVVLESGYEYTYTITVNLTSLDVTSTISPWSTGKSGTGTATMD